MRIRKRGSLRTSRDDASDEDLGMEERPANSEIPQNMPKSKTVMFHPIVFLGLYTIIFVKGKKARVARVQEITKRR